MPNWLAWTLRVLVLLGLLVGFWPGAILWGALMAKQYRDDRKRVRV